MSGFTPSISNSPSNTSHPNPEMALPRHHPPPSPSPSPSPPPRPTKIITPTLLLIIIIVSVLIFISALVCFLVRFFKKKHLNPPSSSSIPQSNTTGDAAISTAEALQRQLQQLFSLHDTGLDQASIDALPVFTYKEILGPKEPFDCAVCLSEFSPKDKLRLLPHCTHAFHIKCIDTWLQSNSTCPLCRGAIFTPGVPLESPVSDCSELKVDPEEGSADHKGVLPVRLGKFRKMEGEDSFVGEASSSNLDARRCYSMGSYEYVVGNTNLRVTLCPRKKKNKAVSSEKSDSPVDGDSEGRRISSVSRGDSYSISKIWLWKKKGPSASLSGSSGIAQIDLPHLSGGIESPIMEIATNV